VELANMNRLFFQPHQAGMSKVEAAERTLRYCMFSSSVLLIKSFIKLCKIVSAALLSQTEKSQQV
jgi:hypothetical protein